MKYISNTFYIIGAIFLISYMFFEQYLPEFLVKDFVKAIILWVLFIGIIIIELIKRIRRHNEKHNL